MGDNSADSAGSDDELYTDAGCYENKGRKHNRLLSDGPYRRNQMSAEICYEVCTNGTIRNTFNYFGTQNSWQCFCGNVENIDSYGLKQDKLKCDKNCKGNEDEKCGGKNNASLYKRKGKEAATTKGLPANPANNISLAGIAIGVAVIACLVFVVVCCFIIWRRRLLRKQNRERSNTYRNAEDINVTSNQNVQRQGNQFSYTELIVYNNNHAYDDLLVETNDTFNSPGIAKSLDISKELSNDNYTILVVPEDQKEGTNSSTMTNKTESFENESDKKALNKTNTTTGAYAMLDPRETGFDRTKQEQEIKADSYAVLDPAETGFDRTKDRDDIPTQSVKHENSDKAIQEHAIKNQVTREERETQNGGTHSITMTNTIQSIEKKAAKKAPKKTKIDVGAYAILDPDATSFNRTKPEQKANDDSYAILDPAETGFDRTKDREDMPSQSAKNENSGKAIHGHAIQNQETNDEGNYSLNKNGQYDVLNQVCRPKDDNEHTYSHSVDAVYDITNQNRTPRTEDSFNAYDHFIGSKTAVDNDQTAVIKR